MNRRLAGAALWLLFAGAAQAAEVRPERTPAQAREELKETAAAYGVPTYRRQNGKVYVNPSSLQTLRELSPPGSGMLQILKVEGEQHTLAAFEGQLLHLQYKTGTNNWRLRKWYDEPESDDEKMYGALIQLSPVEAQKLRTTLAAAFKEEGPWQLQGKNWELGHLKDALGQRSFNCASGWCGLPIGEQGQPLWQVLGLGGSVGDPNSLERLLEARGNEKVFGVAVYGPRVPGFGERPEEPQVKY